MQQAGEEVSKAPPVKAKGSKKKLFVMIGSGIAALVVLGGGFVAYQKFTEVPPPPPRPKLAAKPVTPPAPTAKEIVEKAKEQAAAPVNEVLGTDAAAKPAAPEVKPVAAKPAEPVAPVASAPLPVEEVKPAAPPPPPPPSVAFRGWVENLKISGVRGGANPRVFVGKSSYQPGDLVNPQMGITFEGYNDTARMLTFKDKSGAKVERRN